MATTTDKTQPGAEKVVRSQLSQAFENAKAGIYPEGIDETKLEEPTGIIVSPEISENFEPGENKVSDIVQLGSIRISSESVDDLINMMDLRSLERYIDGFVGAAVSDKLDTQSDQMLGIKARALDTIVKHLEYLKKRAMYVDAIQTYIINTQRRIIIHNKFDINTPWRDPERDTSGIAEILRGHNLHQTYAGWFHPLWEVHAKIDYKILNSQHTLPANAYIAADALSIFENFEKLATPPGPKIPKVIQTSTALLSTVQTFGVHYTAACLDHGYSPKYGTTNPIGLSNRSQIVYSEHLPKLKDLGFYYENRRNPFSIDDGTITAAATQDLTAVFNQESDSTDEPPGFSAASAASAVFRAIPSSPWPNIFPLGFFPAAPLGIASVISPPHDLTRANLSPGHERNPASRVKRIIDGFSKFGKNRETQAFGTSDQDSNIMVLAHVGSMIRSEAVQSKGYRAAETHANQSSNMPNLNRITSLGSQTFDWGAGGTVLGYPDNMSIFNNSQPVNDPGSQLEKISMYRWFGAPGSRDTRTVAPYEKALRSQNLYFDSDKPHPALPRDMYTEFTSKIVDPEVGDEDRATAIDNIYHIFHGLQIQINDYLEYVAKLSDTEPTAGRAGAAIWGETYSESNGTVHTTDVGSGCDATFGELLTRPIMFLHQRFEANNDPTSMFKYWDAGAAGAARILNDQTIIAQATAIIASNKAGPAANKLRSDIVEAIVNRDILRARHPNSTPRGHRPMHFTRIIGYQPSIIARQVRTMASLGAGYQYANQGVNMRNTFEAMAQLGYFSEWLPDGAYFFQRGNNTSAQTSVGRLATLASAQTRIHADSVPTNDQTQLRLRGGINAQQAATVLFQGGSNSPARVMKYNSISEFLSSILGWKPQPTLHAPDIYDEILRVVDYIDETFQSISSPSESSVDMSFGSNVQSTFQIPAGYFHPNAGSTRANGFDRALMISLVVDAWSRVLSDYYEGRTAVMRNYSGMPLNADTYSLSSMNGVPISFQVAQTQMQVTPMISELITKSAALSGRFPLDRMRVLDESHLFDFNEDGVHDEDSEASISAVSGFAKPNTRMKLFWKFESIRGTIRFMRQKRWAYQGADADFLIIPNLAALLMRNACVRGERRCWTTVPFRNNNNEQIHSFNLQKRLGSIVPISPTTLVGASISNPFGGYELSAEDWFKDPNRPQHHPVNPWRWVFKFRPEYTSIGSSNARQFFMKIAEALLFTTHQDGEALRAILKVSDLNKKHLVQATKLKSQKDTYIESTNGPFRGITPPREVSKRQIISKAEYLYNAKRILESDSFSFLNGNQHWPDFFTLCYGAKIFLRNLKVKIESEGPKKFYFFGITPGAYYEKVIANGDSPYNELVAMGTVDEISGVHTRHRNIHGSETSNVLMGIRFNGQSCIEPGLKFKSVAIKRQTIQHEGTEVSSSTIAEDSPRQLETMSLHVQTNEVCKALRFIQDDDGEGIIPPGQEVHAYERIVETLHLIKAISITPAEIIPSSPEGTPDNYAYGGRRAGKIHGYGSNFRNWASNRVERAPKSQYRKKLNSFFMKFILEIVTGISLSENSIGLRVNQLNTSSFDNLLEEMNTSIFTTKPGQPPEGAIDNRVYWEDIRDCFVEDQGSNTTSLRPFNEEFRKDLKPSLDRDPSGQSATPIPVRPKLSNDELVISQIISDAYSIKEYGSLGTTKFEDILMIDFDPSTDMEVDLEATDDIFLNPERTDLKERYRTLQTQLGVSVLWPIIEVESR